MLKLLIVDDEKQIRLGLEKTIPWKDLGIDRVYTAQNASEGLRAYYTYAPQIVLADIRMPGMSGIEMCEKIRAHSKTVRLFLLSGYVNTGFARQAISAGVTEYFLKPVDVDELMEKIGAAAQELLAEGRRQDMDIRLLFETETPPSREYLKSVGLDPHAKGVSCALLKMHSLAEGRSLEMLMQELSLKLHKKNMPNVHQQIFSDSESRTAVLYVNGEYSLISEELYAAAGRHAQQQVRSEELLISLGTEESPFGTHGAFKKALAAMDWAFYYGPDSLIEYQNIQNQKEREIGSFDLSVCDAQTLADLESTLSFCTAAQIGEVKSAAAKFIGLAGGGLPLLSELFKARYIDDVFRCMQACLKDDEKGSGDLAQKIKDFLNEHYTSDISVDELAYSLGKSANYISHVFKKSMGVSVVSYINTLRMKRAGELLRQTNLTVREVSLKAGYHNYNYFTKVFKAFYKTTPAEYRRQA